MGFRITTERIAALKSLAYARLAARANPTTVNLEEEVSEEQKRLLRAAKLAKTHFQQGHAKGILHISAALLGIHLAADGIDKLLADELPYKAGDVLIIGDVPTIMGVYPGYAVHYGLVIDDHNFDANAHDVRSPVFATREQIDAMFVAFEAAIAPPEPADKFLDHIARNS